MELSLDEEKALIEKQESELQFDSFTSQDALDIGLDLVDRARRFGTGIEIDIEYEGHCLFHHGMEGTSSENTDWVRRKKNTMKLMGTSSLLAMLKLNKEGQTIMQKFNVPETEHAAGGGGFLIRIKNKGIAGSIAISGLPHRDDHALVVEAISAHLGKGIKK